MSTGTSKAVRPPTRPVFAAMSILFLAVVGGVALFAAGPADAKPKFLSEFAQAYPNAAGSVLDSCVLCHTDPANPGENNLNAYGRDWENGDIGDKEYLAPALVNRDSDGDGVSNGNEIAQLSLPGDPSSSTPATTTTTVPGAAPDGQAIYAARCASCHGPDGGNLKGTALARSAFISIVLNGQGGMPAQSGLTNQQVGAIWDYLTGAVQATTTTTQPGATTTTTKPASGASVWSSRCASCHGANGGNIVPTTLGKTQLVSIITNGRGGMPGFASLGSTQISNVADYLLSLSATATTRAGSTTTTTTTTQSVGTHSGSDLFMQNCSACHGLHGEGGPGGVLVGTEASRSKIISVVTVGSGGMPEFGTRLTADEIAAIADHVLGLASAAVGDEVGGESGEPSDGAVAQEAVTEYVVVPVPAEDAPGGFPFLAVLIAFVGGAGTAGGLVRWTSFGRRLVS